MSHDILKELGIFILEKRKHGATRKAVFEYLKSYHIQEVLGLFYNPRRQNQGPVGGNCSKISFSLHLYNLCG